MKKLLLVVTILAVLMGTASFIGQVNAAKNDAYRFGLVASLGGINDQGFNQLSWEGLKDLRTDFGYEVKVLESNQAADYVPNLDLLTDDDLDMVWGVGFDMADAMANVARINPRQKFGIVDAQYDVVPDNLVSILFRAQESTFLVGYIAGHMTETDRLGFVGAMKSDVIDQFEYGFRSGIAYAAKELGKDIKVDVQYTESFTDAAKNKSISTLMYSRGVDIILPCGATIGSIEAAKELDKYVMGIDMDQNYLAPDNVITSAVKLVGKAIYDISREVVEGTYLGGVERSFGLAEGGVGIAPTSDKHVPADILAATEKVKQLIINGTIIPPKNEAEFDAFIAALNMK